MDTPLVTLVFDGPQRILQGTCTMTRVAVLDAQGCAIGWYGIDCREGQSYWPYGPETEHPDRARFGWAPGIDMGFALSDGDESWACPSYDEAVMAALVLAAERLVEEEEEAMRHEHAHEAGTVLTVRDDCPDCIDRGGALHCSDCVGTDDAVATDAVLGELARNQRLQEQARARLEELVLDLAHLSREGERLTDVLLQRAGLA